MDIVEKGFDAGVRIGESLHRDMVAVPLGGPITVAVVAPPEYLRRIPAPRHPDELARHNCVRFRFAGAGMIHKMGIPRWMADPQALDAELGKVAKQLRNLLNLAAETGDKAILDRSARQRREPQSYASKKPLGQNVPR